METLLSGEAAANILLPASAAKMRAEKEGIASAVPSSKYRIKRKIIPSDGDRTAQKAKAEQQTQRDASVPRLAFKTAEKLPGAIGVPQQQVPAAQELLEQHANGMQISGEEEQPAAEQDAIQMEASAVNQQQDTAAPKIHQPVHQAEEPSVGDMAGQWWLPQDSFLQQEEIKFPPAPERVDFGLFDPEALQGEEAAQEATTAVARAEFSPAAVEAATNSALSMQHQQQNSAARATQILPELRNWPSAAKSPNASLGRGGREHPAADFGSRGAGGQGGHCSSKAQV